MTQETEVELADGYGIDLVLEESNVKEFVGALYPKEENKAEESVAVFKYDPSEEGSMTLEIIYDHRVHSQYCKRNCSIIHTMFVTIYCLHYLGIQ